MRILVGKPQQKLTCTGLTLCRGGFDSGEQGGIQNLGLVVFCEWISFILRLRIRLRLGGTSFLALWTPQK